MYETDDPGIRVPFVWRHAGGKVWWFEARGVMWLVACFLTVPLVAVTYIVLPDWPLSLIPIPVVIPKAIVAICFGTFTAIRMTRWFGKRVKPTTPIRHHLATVGFELSTPRATDEAVIHLTELPDSAYAENHGAVLYVTSSQEATNA